MKITTLRLPEELYESLEAEANEREISFAEYVRPVLKRRNELSDDGENTQPNTDLENRIDELENVLGELAERVERNEQALTSNERAMANGSSVEVSDDTAPTESEDTAPSTPTALDASIDDAISEALDEWRPGRGHNEREARRESGRAAIEWLRDRGAASASECKREAYPAIGLDGQSADTWWRNVGRPAISAAVDDGVVEYERNVGYEWVGTDTGNGGGPS
jgi:hypothetical protein